MANDGNVAPKLRVSREVIKWNSIPGSKLANLLFLLDIGDKTTGRTPTEQLRRRVDAEESRNVFFLTLTDKNNRFTDMIRVLKKRVKHLEDYPIISLPPGTVAADIAARKEDEDILTLVEACNYLGIRHHFPENKIQQVQMKLALDEGERNGSFFIYAENLRMSRLCDCLTPELVHRLLDIVKQDEILGKHIFQDTKEQRRELEVSLEKVKTEGMKEVLFFYMIRLLEEHDKLNRIYTNKLEDLLKRLCSESDGDSKSKIEGFVRELRNYPSECRPPGHCIIFCVTKDRDGAEGEIKKVKKVFQESLGFTVHVEKDPSSDTLEICRKKLEKQKYRFYDCLVLWFMAHGTETHLQLADRKYERKDIIERFCRLDAFRKKPKIFFMASCRGDSTIPVKKTGGVLVAVDGGHKGEESYSVIPDDCQNITAVYYEMDRLVASATLPNQYSFRLPDGGSVYVDTVCRLLEEYTGENITQVLEATCNKMHQILFSCSDKFDGRAKQACHYETTFQKTFIVPNHSTGNNSSE